ncbi:MAG TPA: hypothetical protein VEJ86_09005, partial [Candidatus Binataceae bacterium]|nr:hypothetical protein [Candidatus Binataceae bacterium]
LGSGALVDLTAFGLSREPIVADSVAAGADVVTFSGDKLLGGPQAGMLVGRRALIERIRRHPLKRALRCDKLTLAALEATLRLYLRSGDLGAELPTLRLLRRSAGELRALADQARAILADRLGGGFEVDVIESTSEVGSGAQPTETIASWAVRVTSAQVSANSIAAAFRRAQVIGRIAGRAFLLDMRTVEDPSALAVDLHGLKPSS